MPYKGHYTNIMGSMDSQLRHRGHGQLRHGGPWTVSCIMGVHGQSVASWGSSDSCVMRSMDSQLRHGSPWTVSCVMGVKGQLHHGGPGTVASWGPMDSCVMWSMDSCVMGVQGQLRHGTSCPLPQAKLRLRHGWPRHLACLAQRLTRRRPGGAVNTTWTGLLAGR